MKTNNRWIAKMKLLSLLFLSSCVYIYVIPITPSGKKKEKESTQLPMPIYDTLLWKHTLYNPMYKWDGKIISVPTPHSMRVYDSIYPKH